MTKRLLSGIMAVLFIFGMVMFVSAAKTSSSVYNPEDALEYASKHWDDGKGLCAEFVSDCILAGGVDDAYDKLVSGLYKRLIDNGWGTSHKLKLTNGTSGRIALADNEGKVKAGDPVFYYCNSCGTFTHVVLCNGTDSEGYLVDYAHNNAHNGNKTTWTYPHCGTSNWTIYSINMGVGEKLYGKATDVKVPKISEIKNTDEGVVIEWNEIKGAEKYRFYRKTPGSGWKLIKTVKTTSYTDTTAKNGVTYLYTVKAVKDGVASQYYGGTENVFLENAERPVVKNKYTKLLISWEKNPEADGYYVYRKVGKGSWERYRDFTSNTKTSFYDTNVSSGTQYYYKVRAYKGEYVSAYSPYKTFIFLGIPELLSISNSENGVTVKWKSVEGANKYRVYRRDAVNTSWKLLDSVTGNSYVDKTAESGVFYTYTVRSAKNNSLGAYDTKGIKRKYLAMPVFTSVQSSKSKVELEWDEVEGANGCIVYRRLKGGKSWSRIAVVRGKNSYIDSDVKLNKTYNYTIRAFYGSAKSAYDKKGTDCLVVKTAAVKPTEPTDSQTTTVVNDTATVKLELPPVASTTPVADVTEAEATTQVVTTTDVTEPTTQNIAE